MKIQNDILGILSSAKVESNNLFLVGDLERKQYLAVNKVLESCGGKWNKKLKCHVFDTDAESRIEEILLTGEVEVPKDEFDYFPSPKSVVDRLVEFADVKSGMTLLEPSAGTGNIAIAFKDCAIMTGVEFNKNNYEKLKELNIFDDLVYGDFLLYTSDEKFDRIVMNPPFSKQADIKHINHAMTMLKPDGILVSVMSSSVIFRTNKLTTEFRNLVKTNGGFFEDLPENSFKSSGTSVNTVIVVIPGKLIS